STHTDIVTDVIEVPGASPDQVVQNHINDMHDLHRVLWYANNTPSTNYDLNELKLWGGGSDYGWFDEQGNVVIDISHMTKGGSFHGAESANPFGLTTEGNLKAAVTLSRDTQNYAFTFDFVNTPDGRTIATIPPDHPAHQLFGDGSGTEK